MLQRIAVRLTDSGEVRLLYAVDAEPLIESGAAEPFLGGADKEPPPKRKRRRAAKPQAPDATSSDEASPEES